MAGQPGNARSAAVNFGFTACAFRVIKKETDKEGDRAERGAEAMSKKVSRGIAGFMLVLAVVFFIYAVSHPEGSFPWSNWITDLIYGIYLAVTVLLFIAPFSSRQRGEKDGMN